MTEPVPPSPTAVENALLGACVDPSLFLDPKLRACRFDRHHGRPLAWRGRFAITVRATNARGETVAVRAFRSGHGPRDVYEILETHRARLPPGLCRPRWIDAGLEVGGCDVPLVSMRWAPGRDLRTSVLTAPSSVLGSMATAWRRLLVDLSTIRMAHGDLRGDNILVELEPGQPPCIRLIDYDGAWLPGAPSEPPEEGDPAFQHPRRTWGPNMDAFPSLLIYLAMRGLEADPALNALADKSEGLLFAHSDLASLNSTVWQVLLASPSSDVARAAALTLDWLSSPADRYDSLETVLRKLDIESHR